MILIYRHVPVNTLEDNYINNEHNSRVYSLLDARISGMNSNKYINSKEDLINLLEDIYNESYNKFGIYELSDFFKNYNGYYDENKINYYKNECGDLCIINNTILHTYFLNINDKYKFTCGELKEFYEELKKETIENIFFFIKRHINIDFNTLSLYPPKDLEFLAEQYFEYIKTQYDF